MSALNKAILIGYVGRDPEVKYSQGGAPVATFSLATSESWADKNGARQEHTEWHNIVAWNKLADLCKQYLIKGRQVYIEGKIRSREWTDRDGNKRRTTEIIAGQIVLLGSRGEGQRPADASPKPTEAGDSGMSDGGEISDSDIPF